MVCHDDEQIAGCFKSGATSRHVFIKFEVFYRGRWMRHVSLTLQASRGCPFDCEFCSIVVMLGHTMRYKKPDAIVAELEQIYRNDLMGRFARRPIFFVDECCARYAVAPFRSFSACPMFSAMKSLPAVSGSLAVLPW